LKKESFATFKIKHGVKSDPLDPSINLLCKLGSIAVHVEESLSKKGHALDVIAVKSLLDDAEVKQWIKDMGVYMPLKRD
jgi:hypothetical protein